MNEPVDAPGDWMITASGVQFRPASPDPEAVRIYDIAHGLANLCRYNGQCRMFYSVAEHSVLLARHFMGRLDYPRARWALVHDGSEAYLGDVVRPLKRALPDYRLIEKAVEAAIFQALGLEGDMPPEIKTADTTILHDERRALFSRAIVERHGWDKPEGLGVEIKGWSPEQARREFLETERFLFGNVLVAE